MERIAITPRPDKKEKLEKIGFSFHSWDSYWREDVCYRFMADEIDMLESVTEELHRMCRHAVQHVIDNNLLGKFRIPEQHHELVRKSWERGETTIYGRFDLAYGGECAVPKMLEYNADTPTSALETAVAQWYWMQEKFPGTDQFNSMHEKLVRRWGKIPVGDPIYFASLKGNEEDWVCVHYLMDTAAQAGHQVKHVYVEDIGHSDKLHPTKFLDSENNPITQLFKLYPWEWMLNEEFGKQLSKLDVSFFEPVWKSILSNKALLPILWELYPDHPNLVPAYFDQHGMDSYARKPIFSREGANVELVRHGISVASDEGPYGAEGYVFQQLIEMPRFDDRYPVIGSWIIGDEAAGICIREDAKRITTNMSNFVPHYFV